MHTFWVNEVPTNVKRSSRAAITTADERSFLDWAAGMTSTRLVAALEKEVPEQAPSGLPTRQIARGDGATGSLMHIRTRLPSISEKPRRKTYETPRRKTLEPQRRKAPQPQKRVKSSILRDFTLPLPTPAKESRPADTSSLDDMEEKLRSRMAKMSPKKEDPSLDIVHV